MLYESRSISSDAAVVNSTLTWRPSQLYLTLKADSQPPTGLTGKMLRVMFCHFAGGVPEIFAANSKMQRTAKFGANSGVKFVLRDIIKN